jgi:hypothetical protein
MNNTKEPWRRWICWILKCELGWWPNIDPTYLWQPYFLHFVSCLNNLETIVNAPNQSFKKPFSLEKQRDNVLKFKTF